MKRTISIAALLLIASLKVSSQVYFHNNYSEPVYVALGYYYNTKEFKGWYSQGWFKVDPGEKKQILSWLPTNGTMYYYAETKGEAKKFEGDVNILVDPQNAFTIKNADKQYVQDDNAAYKWYKFREEDFNSVLLWHTIEFNY